MMFDYVFALAADIVDVVYDWQVLDMCAAPGSKTAQLIELLHATETDSQPGSIVYYRPFRSWTGSRPGSV